MPSSGVRLSIWASVTFVYSVETSKHLFKNFHHRIATYIILFFPHQTLWQRYDGNPLTRGRRMQVVYKKMVNYCCAMLCMSAAYAVMQCVSVCLCVCPSVTFVDSVKTNKHIFNFFHYQVATPF